MAKKSSAPSTPTVASSNDDRWQVEEALHTLQRAGKIVHDTKLMAKVKAMASEKAIEMTAIAKQASSLAKSGRISPKQMAKLGAR